MLFSVNKGRDDLRDSLLMMSEGGNGNEVDNDEMTRSRMIGIHMLCVYEGRRGYVHTRVICVRIEDLISNHNRAPFALFFSFRIRYSRHLSLDQKEIE